MVRWALAVLVTGVLAVLVTGALVGPVAAAPVGESPSAADRVQSTFAAWAQQHRLEAGTLAVTVGGRLVLATAHGRTAPNERVPLASLSKAITAACVARFIESGRLRFDSRLADVRLDLVRTAGRGADTRLREITVAQLLTHRAGFGGDGVPDPAVRAIWELAPSRALERITLDAILERALRRPLGSGPGERYRYSNTGYFALGAVIEGIAGIPYAEACREALLRRLHIKGAGLDPDWGVLASAGGWRLSGPEYLAVYRALEPGRDAVIGPAAKRWMLDDADKHLRDAAGPFYALGVIVRPGTAGEPVWWHTGSWVVRGRRGRTGPLHASFAALVTRTDRGVSWFASCTPDPGVPARQALDAALWRIARESGEWPARDGFDALGLN
jgi:CubicO group peptidase (beta-lactamase class C family)